MITATTVLNASLLSALFAICMGYLSRNQKLGMGFLLSVIVTGLVITAVVGVKYWNT
jgi:hypothetical protein